MRERPGLPLPDGLELTSPTPVAGRRPLVTPLSSTVNTGIWSQRCCLAALAAGTQVARAPPRFRTARFLPRGLLDPLPPPAGTHLAVLRQMSLAWRTSGSVAGALRRPHCMTGPPPPQQQGLLHTALAPRSHYHWHQSAFAAVVCQLTGLFLGRKGRGLHGRIAGMQKWRSTRPPSAGHYSLPSHFRPCHTLPSSLLFLWTTFNLYS